LIFEKHKLGKLPPLKMPDLNKQNFLPKTKTLDLQDSMSQFENQLDLKKALLKDLTKRLPNGLRYLRVGGRGLCLGAEKTRSQKNA
ncbi:MAG: hypothetical protein UZ14_CFX002001764, partial [Chloroflexi bacterium OLB14]